jgi:protein TonB
MNKPLAHIIFSVLICVGFTSFARAQGGKRENPLNPPPKRKIPHNKPIKPGEPKKAETDGSDAVQLASVTITVAPAGSALFLNNQQFDGPTLRGLMPGLYVLKVMREGYQEDLRSITLVPGENSPISILLQPIQGTLNVLPNIAGAVINVRRTESNGTFEEHYVGELANLKLIPGDYEVTVSKEGYKTVTRKVNLQASGTVYLEPQLQMLPTSSPTPAISQRSTFSPDGAMTIETSDDGKYILVSLVGRSGQTTDSAGSLKVTLNPSDPSPNAASVTGMLTGFPSRVDFLPLDNIAQGSIVENPEPANRWARILVRLRVVDFSRPSRFAINWTRLPPKSETLQPAGVEGPEQAPSRPKEVYEPAVVRKKFLPAYPAAARTANVTGLVIVSVQIDEQGDVKSAKAGTGPLLLHRAAENAAKQWKFNPARKNGRPVQDTQQIRFMFQR